MLGISVNCSLASVSLYHGYSTIRLKKALLRIFITVQNFRCSQITTAGVHYASGFSVVYDMWILG